MGEPSRGGRERRGGGTGRLPASIRTARGRVPGTSGAGGRAGAPPERGSPSLPHLTVLAGVHGRAQRAAEVLHEVPRVAEGADDAVLVGAVRVGHQPFVRALGCPHRAPHLGEGNGCRDGVGTEALHGGGG